MSEKEAKMGRLSFSNTPLHFSRSPRTVLTSCLHEHLTQCEDAGVWASLWFFPQLSTALPSKMNSHILFLSPPTSTLIFLKSQKTKKLPCRHGMLTLLFLGNSTSDGVLEEISPPMAVGAGARLHRDILGGQSAHAPGLCGTEPDSGVLAVAPEKQDVFQSQRMSWS